MAAGILTKSVATDEHQRTKIEVVTHTAQLIVDNGMSNRLAVLDRVVVAVDHHGTGLVGHLLQALKSIVSEGERRGLHVQKGEIGIGILGDAQYCATRLDIVDDDEGCVLKGFVRGGKVLGHQKVYVLHCTALPQLADKRLDGGNVVAG